MRINYFKYKDKKYYTGTVVKTNDGCKRTFLYQDIKWDYCWYKTDMYGTTGISTKSFFNQMSEITGEFDSTAEFVDKKRKKELNISGMFEGWILYVLGMIFGAIFNERIYWWCGISIIFFTWRQNKIDKEGYYY